MIDTIEEIESCLDRLKQERQDLLQRKEALEAETMKEKEGRYFTNVDEKGRGWFSQVQKVSNRAEGVQFYIYARYDPTYYAINVDQIHYAHLRTEITQEEYEAAKTAMIAQMSCNLQQSQ